MLIRRIGCLFVAGLILTVGLGCGGGKTSTPKAPEGVDLKPLANPGAPGGGAGPAPAKGGGAGANVQ